MRIGCVCVCVICVPLQFNIGFRVYMKNGDKKDERGRYRGHSSKFDERIPITHRYRFSRFGSRAGTNAIVQGEPIDTRADPEFEFLGPDLVESGPQEEEEADVVVVDSPEEANVCHCDSEAVLNGIRCLSTGVHSVYRGARYASPTLVDCLNYFGDIGGFVALTQQVLALGPKTCRACGVLSDSVGGLATLERLAALSAVAAPIAPLLNSNFAERFYRVFIRSVARVMESMPDDSLKLFQSDKLDELTALLKTASEYFLTRFEVGKVLESLKLNVGLRCLRSDIFTVRLAGFKILMAFTKAVLQHCCGKKTISNSLQGPKYYSAERYLEWVSKSGVVEEVSNCALLIAWLACAFISLRVCLSQRLSALLADVWSAHEPRDCDQER